MVQLTKPFPNKLPITPDAFDKALLYTQATAEVLGAPSECMGYMIRPADTDDITVTDVTYLEAESINTHVWGQNSLAALLEIEEKGYITVGWWHSHPNFSTTPSGTDERTTYSMLADFAPNLQRIFKHPYRPKIETENGLAIIKFDEAYELKIPEDCLDKIVEVNALRYPTYVFALVVNLFGEYSALIGKREHLARTFVDSLEQKTGLRARSAVYPLATADCEFVKEKNGLILDYNLLREEVRGKIKKPEPPASLAPKKSIIRLPITISSKKGPVKTALAKIGVGGRGSGGGKSKAARRRERREERRRKKYAKRRRKVQPPNPD